MSAESSIVDRDSPLPIYRQLANWMTSKITRGDWPTNYQLPAEVDLARQLGVSRGSLRKAIGLLVSRDLLWQVHGKGTLVRPVVVEQRWASQLIGTYEELLAMGIPFATEVLEQRVLASPKREGQILELNPGDQVVYLKRLVRVGNVPIVLHENYLPAARYADLLGVDFTEERLLATLGERYRLSLTRADHAIAAIRADADVASRLELDVDDPVLYNEPIVYDDNDREVEFGKSWFRGDRLRLRTAVRREGGQMTSMPLPSPSQEPNHERRGPPSFCEETRSPWLPSRAKPAGLVEVVGRVPQGEDDMPCEGPDCLGAH